MNVEKFEIHPIPMVSKDHLQRVDISYICDQPMHLLLRVLREGEPVAQTLVAMNGGRGGVCAMLPVQKESFQAKWQLIDKAENVVAETIADWICPRERTIYIMLSSHTDIGLHNSQYIQRYNSCRFLDMAKELCDATENRAETDRYRYTMEGTWFWNNYSMDRGGPAAQEVVEKYIKPGKIGVCCGMAGNHTQVYGLEEMCRSTYEKKRLHEMWNVDCETMTMIDNNGLSMGMIQPYGEAGIKNIIFAPNHWNPLPSTVWKMDVRQPSTFWNTNAGGGGARMDIRYESNLPMVFWWEDAHRNRILVWGSTQYNYGSAAFGIYSAKDINSLTLPIMEESMASQLLLMEEKYPYDVWLMCCYSDDQAPDIRVTDTIKLWNEHWQWPKLRTLGNPDEPFRVLREKHGHDLPVLRGDITGGWYQHPVAAPELLAQKFSVDRMLPTAEKWSAVAAAMDETYGYPAERFRRGWDYLLYNDEHSYGTSGYQGRRVYETWMQHRDWIDKAEKIAQQESADALRSIAKKIYTETDSIAVFNPTALQRQELITCEDGCGIVDVPPFGYRVVEKDAFHKDIQKYEIMEIPPVIENPFYKVIFAENGSMVSIFDKEQRRELLDAETGYHANELLYTADNHKTFAVPGKATFTICKEQYKTNVTIRTEIVGLGAEIVQTVTLPEQEKRIDIDNRLYHVRDMVNQNRYNRYLYCAFPFAVENSRRFCHVNGAVAEYTKDITGHGTDVYMAVNEWCCSENLEHGVALFMLDSQLVEFDHIHPDKTDFGDAGAGSRMYVYLANDWLQMHTPGGSHLNYQFRFSIVSYEAGYQKAGIPRIAERFANPVQLVQIPKQKGVLKGEYKSFLKVKRGQRLVSLKRADDGNGVVARLYGDCTNVTFTSDFEQKILAQRISVDEQELPKTESCENGFSTYRLGGDILRLKERVERGPIFDGTPMPIGSEYTGLITEPRAAAGENPGHLYLLWGQSIEPNFSHYKLYRSEVSGFTANAETFIADIQPEEYRVGRYEDTGLKEHTRYYYRVRGVNQQGEMGILSEEFSAITRETIV